MHRISSFKAGIALGLVLGLYHLCWALLVAAGWAKPVIDFVLRLHFIGLPLDIQPFNAVTAVELVALTTVVGFIFGFVLATAWNCSRPRP